MPRRAVPRARLDDCRVPAPARRVRLSSDLRGRARRPGAHAVLQRWQAANAFNALSVQNCHKDRKVTKAKARERAVRAGTPARSCNLAEPGLARHGSLPVPACQQPVQRLFRTGRVPCSTARFHLQPLGCITKQRHVITGFMDAWADQVASKTACWRATRIVSGEAGAPARSGMARVRPETTSELPR